MAAAAVVVGTAAAAVGVVAGGAKVAAAEGVIAEGAEVAAGPRLELLVGGGEEWCTLGLKVCPSQVFTMVGQENERKWKRRGGGGGGGGEGEASKPINGDRK